MKRKLSKITSAILASVILFTSNVFAGDITINVNGLTQPIEAKTINRDGYTLVAMRDMFNMLGADVDWNSVKRCVTAKKGDKEIILYVDSSTSVIDKKEKAIEPVGVEIIDGTTYVPLRFVSEAFGADVDWNGESRIITIKTEEGRYLFLNDKQDVSEETQVLTYEEALQMAKNKNSNLKNLEDTMYYLEELRDDLGENLHSIDEYGVFLNTYEPDGTGTISDYTSLQLSMYENAASSISLVRNIKSVDVSKSEKAINEEMINDTIELGLISAINNIKTYEMNIQLLEENIAIGEQSLANTKLKLELGRESEYNYKTEENNLKTSKSNLEKLKLGLENQKQDLKTMLGADASEEIYVDDPVEFDTLEDFDLESFITKKKEADPSIILLKDALDVAKYNLRTNTYATDENRVQLENEVKIAGRKLTDAQDQMEKNIRNSYNSLKQLEENNKSLLVAVNQAKEDYNAVSVSYLAGRATQLQVDQAKLGILNAEKAVEDNAISYENLSFCLKRPYLLSSGN